MSIVSSFYLDIIKEKLLKFKTKHKVKCHVIHCSAVENCGITQQQPAEDEPMPMLLLIATYDGLSRHALACLAERGCVMLIG